MSVTIDSKKNIFKIDTENTSYVLGVDEAGNLLHYYYGGRVDDTDLSYLKFVMDGISPLQGDGVNPFSMNALSQEYPTMDVGDYRISSLSVKGQNGCISTQLKFVSAQKRDGKYSISGMPAVYAEDNEAQTLEIILKDSLTGLAVTLLYSVVEGFDAVMRSAKLYNSSKDTLYIEKASSCCLDLPSDRYSLLHLSGKWGAERYVETEHLTTNIRTISSKKGASGHNHNPFAALLSDGADENYGEVYAIALAYSGNFSIQVESDAYNQTRLVAGIEPENFSWCLNPNESFFVPEAILTYSNNGLGGISRTYHELLRTHMCRGKWKNIRRPILVNNWEATYFDFDEEKIYSIAESASKLGIEMLVLDDGWFGNRNSDNSSLGDWYVNTEKIRGGLPKLVERINALGMKFGLWFEPEMISPNSDLFRLHPDWCLCAKGRVPSLGRNQYVLDLTRPEVREYIFFSLSKILNSANIEYIKWDFNRTLSEVGSPCLPYKNQQEASHRYVLGLYELLERINSAYPDILIESCAGGGGRFDAGMLYYSTQIWTSDNTDALDRCKIQYGTSIAYPLSSMGAHVSVCPNHQTKRITPFSTRGNVALTGAFGYELDVTALTEDECDLVRAQIEYYKKWSNVVSSGDLYRLINPFVQENYSAWEVVSKDKNSAIVTFVVLKGEFHAMLNMKLCGLEAQKKYRCIETGREYYGSTLMNAGLRIAERYYFRSGDSRRFTFVSI